VIELALNGAEAGFDITEALPESQLGKSETKKLIEAGKAAEFVIAAVARNALLELVRRKVIHQLGEDDAADMHASLSEPVVGRPPEAGIIPGKFKSKNLRGPSILFTSLRLSVSFEAIAGH
jgi:hypothetical protein